MNRPKISQQPRRETPKQPVACPWVANQPYPSPLANKNRNSSQRRNSTVQTNNCLNNHWETSNSQNSCGSPTFSSMQQSSNQFFLFLRLMQLFPHTHPATLHSVLYICKNDFFCAIDKLLYAKRCKILYNNRKDQLQQLRSDEQFSVLNENEDAVENPLKRSLSKDQNDDDNEICRESKMIKINLENVQIDTKCEKVNDSIKLNGLNMGDKLPDTEVHVEPVGTIKFITIKTNNIQDKVNIADLEKVDLKFAEEIS